MTATEKERPEIWAVGGGKGGTGKTFIISSIGNCMALKGKRIVLIDADLGGANLHTFLGIAKPKASLTDFLDKKLPLADLVVDSGIQNMGLLTGTIHSLASDGLKYSQKLKLFRHIKKLDADYVLIDLGAGAHFNTLDTFLLADKKIIVIVPEITSIENTYFFLKNALFRQLVKTLADRGFKDLIQSTWKNRDDYNINNLNQLLGYLRGMSKTLESIVNQELSGFRPHIVLNRITAGREAVIGNSLKSVCRKYFGLDACYVGCIEYDPIIPKCINKSRPLMQAYPTSPRVEEIERVTANLLDGKEFDSRV